MKASICPIRSLLLVDDSNVQRRQIGDLCRQLGVGHVHESHHGADALAKLADLKPAPEAVIVDLEMPVMDGVQFIQELKARDVRLPFIVASTHEATLIDAVETMARALGRPPAATLRKPIAVDALRVALDACAHGAPTGDGVAPIRPSTAPSFDAGHLARAIERGEIVPHYQPKVDARTALLRGVEVLARWQDPTLGSVPPDQFIDAAEKHGLIHSLTLSILDQALGQAAHWRARGLRPSIAVNLSPSLLMLPQLVDQLGARLLRHGTRPEQVVLEITEGSVVAQQGTALGTLARLRMQGYGLSIDDYGTGFSSMQQLSRIPFTELKIDRSFVHGAHRHQHLRVILQSAIDIAASLSITSVAEGVETLADWQLLQRLGCGLMQGWLIGKAMPGGALNDWLRQHAHRLPELRAPRAFRKQPDNATPSP